MDIEVKMGKTAGVKWRGVLSASGVGSCVIITLYDPKLKIGAMAHAMLPSRDEVQTTRKKEGCARYKKEDTRYVDAAIDEMLKKMGAQNPDRRNLEAKIVGGANMFSAFNSDIGEKNILSAEKKLKREGIKIAGKSVGGSIGRSVEFCVASGIMTVKVKF